MTTPDECPRCINCDAPRAPKGPEEARTVFECGSFLTPSGKWIPEYVTPMCSYAAALRHERDAMRRVVEAAEAWRDEPTKHGRYGIRQAVDEYRKEQTDG